MREDLLKQQLMDYARHGADAALQPGAADIRRRARRHYRRIAALTATGVLLAAGLVVGLGLRGGSTIPTVNQPNPPATNPGPTPTRPPVTTTPTTLPPTSTATTAKAAPGVTLRSDGLGVAGFGAAEREALGRLRRELGPPDETGSWNGATPFGTCPGDTRAVRWGRLYVLFTNGPTRYAPSGTWHLFAYQVDAVQRTKVDPQYNGPTPPPEPPPLRGYSPKTAAGIGFGSTLAELRAAYGGRLRVSSGLPGPVHRFQVRLDAGELSGSLSGRTPSATVTGLAAGAVCGE
jgi:hypothetical protein